MIDIHLNKMDSILSVNPTNRVSLNQTLRYDAVGTRGIQEIISGTRRPAAYIALLSP
jgi:hypothetical protein